MYWGNINWEKAKAYVNRLQIRIVKAVQKGKWNLVKRLQYLLVHSFYAKALSVRRVTTNKGKRTAGVDNILWKTAEDKIKAIYEMDIKCYSPLPLKRVYIEKFGKKEKRPLSIPTIKDRAMQALFLLALEPVAETTADKTSFGFRKYRSTHDAMSHIFNLMAKDSAPKWILEGDIKGCFDNISHKYLHENIHMDKTILRKFLKAGFVFEKELFLTDAGTPQGGPISPTLANATLDGMEKVLAQAFWVNSKGKIDKKHKNIGYINLIRYADDFIITAKNKEIAGKAQEVIKQFLSTRGLILSEEKTTITNIHDGFDFLGWNFRKYKKKLIIKPSRNSINKVTKAIGSIIRDNKASSQKEVILKLNQTIRGWANYHQPVCSKLTYSKLDNMIWNMLWSWAKRRHPNKSNPWVMKKYWQRVGTRKWVFTNGNITLINSFDTPVVRHIALKLDKNPFTDKAYFETRRQSQQRRRKAAFLNTTAARTQVRVMNA